jgi:hypothetical protein
MTETTTLNLRNLTSWTAFFRLLTAEWWDENSKFVVVRGATSTDPEDFALRLDIEKRAFLDHASNSTVDTLLQSQVQEISRLVWSERVAQREKHHTAKAAF